MPRSARAMKSLEVTVTIDHKGQLSIDSLVDIPIGAYKAVLVLEDQPIPGRILSLGGKNDDPP